MKDEIENGSLFSGVGGIELGFEQAGFETKWFIENDTYAQAILKKRFPNAKIYGDIKEVDFRSILKVQVLTGGFPCQDISNAGKRVGITGSRSSLWKYYYKAIRILRPKIAFIENVSALLGRGLDVVLADLAKIGYDAEWYCVSASSVGANHQRDRIFIIAYPFNSNGRRDNWKQCQKGIQEEAKDVSNTNWKGQQRKWQIKVRHTEFSNSKSIRFRGGDMQDNTWNKSKNKQNRNKSRSKVKQYLWSNESKSRICRVANGIPNRIHRIKCLGNAVVPQVAEVFAKAIKENYYEGDYEK